MSSEIDTSPQPAQHSKSPEPATQEDDDEIQASIKQDPSLEDANDDEQSHLNDSTQPASLDDLPASLRMDGAGDSFENQAPHAESGEPELRIPQKKDATLREFLGKMEDYAPIIPDAVTNYYLTIAGLPPPPQTPPALARLLALATQKFVADVAADAYQYARIRSSHTTSNTANAMMGANLGLPGQGPPSGGAPGGVGVGPGGATAGGGAKEGEKGGKGSGPLGTQRPGFGGGGTGGQQGRTVLTMEDLGMAVGEYGLNVRRGEFYR